MLKLMDKEIIKILRKLVFLTWPYVYMWVREARDDVEEMATQGPYRQV